MIAFVLLAMCAGCSGLRERTLDDVAANLNLGRPGESLRVGVVPVAWDGETLLEKTDPETSPATGPDAGVPLVFDEGEFFEAQQGLLDAVRAMGGVADAELARGDESRYDVVIRATLSDPQAEFAGRNNYLWPGVVIHTLLRIPAYWIADENYELRFRTTLRIERPSNPSATREAKDMLATARSALSHLDRTTRWSDHLLAFFVPPTILREEPRAVVRSLAPACWREALRMALSATPSAGPSGEPKPASPEVSPDNGKDRAGAAVSPGAGSAASLPGPLGAPAKAGPRSAPEKSSPRPDAGSSRSSVKKPGIVSPLPSPSPERREYRESKDVSRGRGGVQTETRAERPERSIEAGAGGAGVSRTPTGGRPAGEKGGVEPPGKGLKAAFRLESANLPETLRAEVYTTAAYASPDGLQHSYLRFRALGNDVFIERVGTARQTIWPLAVSRRTRPPPRTVYLLELTADGVGAGKDYEVRVTSGETGRVRVTPAR